MNFTIENKAFFIEDYKPTKSNLYEINNFEAYKLTETKEDFIALEISLFAFGECLEELHEGFADCGFVMAESEADIIAGVLDYTAVYDSLESFINEARENYAEAWADDYGTFSDYMASYLESDCFVMAYDGKIYRRVFC